jgi:glycerol-3-phosphate dehydrogenase (NAD(P)+)
MRIGVIGAGGWGTALSIILANNGHNVHIWAYESEVSSEINNNKTNNTYLKGVQLHDSIRSSNNLDDLSEEDLYVIAIPTQHIRSVLVRSGKLLQNKNVVNVAKGIERVTLLRISQLVKDICGVDEKNYSVLTGPSHAEEASRQKPTTIVAASANIELTKLVQNAFSNQSFRVYSSTDVIGCEIGGALKNVIAIAAGMIDGLGLGDNTKAAVITRGLAELSRLGVAIGANPLTFSGLSGLGDLYVTCSSRLSRNRYVGEQIGLGRKLHDIIDEMKMVAEGVSTAESAHQLSLRYNVELPITEHINNILFHGEEPLDAIRELMTRQSKGEWWW